MSLRGSRAGREASENDGLAHGRESEACHQHGASAQSRDRACAASGREHSGALPIVPVTEQPQPAAATPDSDGTVMGKLQSATATVQRIPQWAARSVAGWFAEETPPRPPAAVPVQDFRAAM